MAVKAEIQLVASGAASVARELGAVESALGRMSTFASNAGKLLGGFLGVAVAREIAQSFRGIVAGMEEIYEASQKVGMSTEALSGLKYAAEQSGVSFEQLTGGLVKFSRAIVEAQTGNKELASLLQQIGISAEDTAETGLAKVAEAFSRMPDGIAKTDAAVRLFGRSGAELIPFLNEGARGLERLREEARALGIELSGEAAAAADAFGDNLDKLGTAMTGFGQAIASDALPGLVDLTNAMTLAIKEGQGLSGTIGALIKGLVDLNRYGSDIVGVDAALAEEERRLAGIERSIEKYKAIRDGLADESWLSSAARAIGGNTVVNQLESLTEQAAASKEKITELRGALADYAVREEAAAKAAERRNKQLSITVQGEEKKAKAVTRSAKATSDLAKAEQKHADEVERALKSLQIEYIELTQGARARYEMELATKGWTEAEREAALALYDQNEALRKTQAELKKTGEETNVYAEVVEDAARGMRSAFSSFFEDLLTDGAKAFKNFGDMVKRLFIKLLADLMSAALANPIRILLGTVGIGGVEGALAGAAGTALSGAAGGSAASLGGGILGNAASSLLGSLTGFSGALGSGLGALATAVFGGAPAGLLGTAGNLLSFGTAGLTSGTLAGAAAGLGALASVALPIVGAVAGIASLFGAFGDSSPDNEWFRLFTGTRHSKDSMAPLYARDSPFGLTGISGNEDLRGSTERSLPPRIIDPLVQLDQWIASQLTAEQVAMGKASVNTFLHMTDKIPEGASYSSYVGKAIKQRYYYIFKGIDETVLDVITSAANDPASVEAAVREAVARITGRTTAAAENTALRDAINAAVERDLLAIRDPFAAALANLDAEFAALREQATASGADLAKIEELYGLKRAEILRQQAEIALEEAKAVVREQIAVLQRQADDIISTFGDIVGAMAEIEPPAELLVDAWRRTKSELQSLQSGLDALIGAVAQTDLQKLDGLLNVVAGFRTLADSISDQIFSARLSGASPAGQVRLYAAREAGLWEQLETAADADKAGIAQQITDAVIGRIRAQGQADLQATQSIYDAQYDSAVTAAELTAQAREAEIDALREQIDAAEEMADQAERLAEIVASMGQFVDALRIGDLSALNPGDQLNVAQRQFRTALTGARSGDMEALENLQDFASTYLEEAQGYYGGATSPYAAIFREVTSALDNLNVRIAQPPDIELLEQQLAALEAQEQAAIDLQRATVDTSAQEVAALETLRIDWLGMATQYQVRADDQVTLIRDQIAQLEVIVEGQEAQIRQQAAMHQELMEQMAALNAGIDDLVAQTNLEAAGT